MIFSCEKQYLSEAVNTVIKAVATKSPNPVLEGILISTDDDSIILTSNNLEMGIVCKVPANVSVNGSIVIDDARVFSEIIRKLPNDLINIEVKENFVTTIKCQKSVYNIMGISPIEFPELPSILDYQTFEIESDKLKKMIRQTSYAISVKEDKPTLTGSLFNIEDGFLTIVSLDGFRMALRKEKISSTEAFKFIIPGKTLNEIVKILKDEETPVVVKVTDKYVLFEIDNTKIISRLIEGEFFNYKTIIPEDFKITAIVNLSDLIISVERADPIVSVDVFNNPVKMTIDEDSITIDCMTATGKAHDVIEVDNCNGEIELGFNQRYLHDALGACECDKIVLKFNGSLNPCIITPFEGDEFIYMVMPVRLKND